MKIDIGLKRKEVNAYLSAVNDKFTACGGRLLLAETSKLLALTAAQQVYKKSGARSLLYIVSDVDTARETAQILSRTIGAVRVIEDIGEAGEAVAEVDVTNVETARARSEKFRVVNPKLIVPFAGKDGSPLFNGKLFDNTTASGKYVKAPTAVASYCLSDFLADCEYEFVVIDGIYDMFDLREAPRGGRSHTVKFSPHEYEDVCLKGRRYFADTAHSYKRLCAVTSGAKGVIAVADTVVADNIAEFYLALSVVNARFNAKKERSSYVPEGDDYDEECADIASALTEEFVGISVASACLRRARNAIQNVLPSAESVIEYVNARFDYMSEEESLLRFVSACKAVCHGSRTMSEFLDEAGEDEIAAVITEMFFANDLKATLENNLHSLSVRELTEGEIALLAKTFLANGIYRQTKDDIDCNVLRFYRDDSYFERYLRGLGLLGGEQNGCSVYGEKSIAHYKCDVIADMMRRDGKKSKNKYPLIVVAERGKDEIKAILTKMAGEERVTCDLGAFEAEANDVLVSDYASLRKTARNLHSNTVIYAETPTNPMDFACVAGKLSLGCDGESTVFISYETVNGVIADVWDRELDIFGGGALPPIDASEIKLANEKTCPYGDVTEAVNAFYITAIRLISGYGDKEACADFVKNYNKTVRELTSNVTYPAKEEALDAAFLCKAGADLRQIYYNSFAVGGEGERVVYTTERGVTEFGRGILFDVCARELRRTCDLRRKDCNGCADYDRLMRNHGDEFTAGIDSFVTTAKSAIAEREERMNQVDVEVTIRSTNMSDGNDRKLLASEVAAASDKVEELLGKYADYACDACGKYYVPYDIIEGLRKVVTGLYAKIADKYFAVARDVINLANGTLIDNYAVAKRGFDVAYEE